MITAPFNFVPLNEKVFFPPWAEDVSHDVPFEDAQSGEITIKIIAKSPIFIRNHNSDRENKSSEFCNYKGKYFIPATSIKGVLKTLVEVMSFSKLQLQDKRLAYRDLNHPSYKKKAMDTNKIYMGWMRKEGEDVIIESLGKVTNGETRIKYKQMYDYFDEKLVDKLKRTKEAYKKYAIFKDKSFQIDIGTVVFTGSTGNKTREFLFPNTKPQKVHRFSQEDALFKTFLHSYYIGTPNESKDWKNLWSKKFQAGEKIPVFFQLDDDENIKHFGLSMLYKLPYEHTLQSLLENYQEFQEKPDLAETIFGFVKESDALKGRVFFSHFFATQPKNYNKTVILPLSSPRATFYPNYVVQCSPDGATQKFITYDHKNAILRGFKFYPPRRELITSDEMCEKNANICTRFRPLDAGSTFVGKMRFHNLKTVEIGALLAAITFIGNERCFHKIGMAKAYGFGTVALSIEKTTLKHKEKHYIDTFTKTIENSLHLQTAFMQHPRVKALFKLCSYDSFSDKELRFMDIKRFVNAKKPFNKFVLKEVVPNGYDKSKLPCKKQQRPTMKKQASSDAKLHKLDGLFGGNANVAKPKQSGLKIVKKGKKKE